MTALLALGVRSVGVEIPETYRSGVAAGNKTREGESQLWATMGLALASL